LREERHGFDATIALAPARSQQLRDRAGAALWIAGRLIHGGSPCLSRKYDHLCHAPAAKSAVPNL